MAASAFGQAQPSTRPPEGNDRMLRPITPEEIPPNLNFYAIDPLYNPNAVLGWANARIEEKLDRGVIAISTGSGAYVSWRLLNSDPPDVAFNVYRSGVRLNAQPVRSTTDFADTAAAQGEHAYSVRAVVNGREQEASAAVSAGAAYRVIKLRDVTRGVDRVAIGDLNGEGTYDFLVKHPAGSIDPGRIRPGADTYIWFSPMVVRDLDGDNKAEVCLRTAPYAGTREAAIDGGRGIILDGPEHLAVYDGATGREIDSVDWIERGKVTDWADTTANRSSRHMLGIAYLDGKTPSVLVVRGTYGLMKVDAWTLRNRKLEKVWRWTTERAPFKYHGQGQHSIKVGDIDGDGFDEILNGSIAIDHDGRTLWSTGLGHGDRFYLTDIDPGRPGLEVWYTIEDPHPRDGLSLWDAVTGQLIFGLKHPNNDNQIAGGLVGDIGFVQQVADITGDWREEVVTVFNGELRIHSTSVPATDRRVTLMQDPIYRHDVTHRSMGYSHTPMTGYYLGTGNQAATVRRR